MEQVIEAESQPVAEGKPVLQKIAELLQEEKVMGFAVVVADTDGATKPLVGARNLGELLIMQKILDKEINRLADSTLVPKTAE
jgi:hypothetical protein